ncbi:Type IV secretion system protein VirB11 [Labrenzia sp. THAF82]|uniref:CpaF/VirB11 family protein n=1 Tax=Labrenzia sp. THAF82 TaxID=2587861 RepID=UPI0012684748|nr:CpaF/VirB11 family protein [Labrenzia sp. THAF82]QFT29578.1 Type IV secretion system protein VirB11 [Labrenzia sp. THAF82]
MSQVLLEKILEPLSRHYAGSEVVEVRTKVPGKLIVERRDLDNRIAEVVEPELTLYRIKTICRALANMKGLEFDPTAKPQLSTVLPGGHRFECLLGNSVVSGLSLAIRCKHPHRVRLEDMGLGPDMIAYLKAALDQQRNIAISGSTNTGKTTLLNNLLSYLPDDRRVVSAEDTPELDVGRFYNGVSLLAARDTAQGAGLRTWQQLYDHKMRISPDNILFGEISTQNAFAALNVLNTGARGWMCTVHAESAELVPARFQENINAAGQTLPDAEGFMRKLVDLVIHIRRDPRGQRSISEIFEMKNDRYILREGRTVQ